MTPDTLFFSAAAAMVGFGAAAGFFLTFSDLVMPSLARTRGTGGIDAMQVINRRVNASMSVFLLWIMVPLGVAIPVIDRLTVGSPRGLYFTAGAALYVVGVLGVSMWFNVPMNNHLETLNADSETTSKYWRSTFVPRWVFWNYVRVAASAGSAACFAFAVAVVR